MGKLGRLVIAAVVLAGPVQAQFGSIREYLPSGNHPRGVTIGGVSGYVNRFWTDDLINPALIGRQPLAAQSDTMYGLATTIGWNAISGKSTFGIRYSPAYNGSTRFSSFNRMNHNLSFVTNHPLQTSGKRWSADASGSASINTFETYFFQPTQLSQVASTPSTFDDLAAAVLSRGHSNDVLGQALALNSPADTPLTPFFFGSRFLNLSVQTGVTYSYSSRLRMRFGANGNRTQPLTDELRAGSEGGAAAPTANQDRTGLLRHATLAQGNFTVNYSLTPRTEIGGTFAVNKSFVQSGGYYGTTTMATIARTLTRNIFAQARAGAAQAHANGRVPFTVSSKPNWVAGGAIGFKTYRHTFLANVDRTINYTYGLANRSLQVAGGWGWTNMRQSWWLNAGVTREQYETQTGNNLKSWRGNASIGKFLLNQLSIELQYAKADYRGTMALTRYDMGFGMARVSLAWVPFRVRAR
jgi:hypothetical protein